MNAASADRPDATEAMVALTDLAIGVECVALAALVLTERLPARSGLRGPLLAFLGATASASLTGAALHGLTTDRADLRRRALWRWSLASIGIGGLSSWWLGARIGLRPASARVVEVVATLAHVPYVAHVVSGDRPFRVAIASYVPGALFLGAALASRLGERSSRGPAAIGLAGLGVTFAAAGVQQARVGLGRSFDHNALFHTLQAIGIAFLFAAGRRLRSRS